MVLLTQATRLVAWLLLLAAVLAGVQVSVHSSRGGGQPQSLPMVVQHLVMHTCRRLVPVQGLGSPSMPNNHRVLPDTVPLPG